MNVLDPKDLFLSEEAFKVFTEFHDEIEKELAEGGIYEGIRTFANKSPEHAARLAATLTLVEDLAAQSVPEEKMKNAIRLVRYYLSEALRLHAAVATDKNVILAEKLLEWARKRGRYFSLVEAYQAGPTACRKKSKALQLVSILMDHNLIRPVQGGMEIGGNFRREVYEILD